MIKTINVANKKKAIEQIERFSNKSYEPFDIEFTNVHLKEINCLCSYKLFDKNNLYISSTTLWELCQKEGKVGRHHFHGLSPNEIYETLKNINKPCFVYESYQSRYVVATSNKNKNGEQFVVIIELHAGLRNDRNANINKLVSLYPKKNINNVIKQLNNKSILYKK